MSPEVTPEPGFERSAWTTPTLVDFADVSETAGKDFNDVETGDGGASSGPS